MADQLFDKRLIFLTGKGGVGKTTIVGALGYLASRCGKKVLLCELEQRGNLASVFGLDKIDYAPLKVQDNLYIMSMDTGQSLTEYVHLMLKLPNFAPLGPLNSLFELFSMAAPGVREVLSVGKLCYEVRENHYDLVIADSSATGHVVGTLATSKHVNTLIDKGIIREQTDWMDDILYDPQQTCVSVVTTAQETPVLETLDLIERILSSVNIGLGPIFANRIMNEIFNDKEEQLFQRLAAGDTGKLLFQAIADKNFPGRNLDKSFSEEILSEIFSAASLSMQIRREEELQLRYLASRLQGLDKTSQAKSETPETYYIPYLFGDKDLFSMTKRIAANLADELSVDL